MKFDFLSWIGYTASLIILVSMSMNSILKFRLINVFGAMLFSIYGYSIKAYPVGILNSIIFSIDVYYLVSIYSKKEYFEILEVRPDNKYLLRFLEFHKNDIQKFFPGFVYKPDLNSISFFILRDMSVTGLFLAHYENDSCVKVGLDYVIPEYRDLKNGKYVYTKLKRTFLSAGCKKVKADGNSLKHAKYLKKLGFKESENNLYVWTIE